MLRDSNVAARGQVFYYNPIWGVYGRGKEPRTHQNNGSLEFKTRPYLVISTNKGNFSSTTCNIIPITTRGDTVIPSQVKFIFNDRPQVILTEQITTCNIKDLGDYCYTVSEEILCRVQKGIHIQFGLNLKTPEVTMEELAIRLESVVDKVLENAKRKTQAVTIPQDTIDNLALKFGSVVEELVSTPEHIAVVPKTLDKEEPKPTVQDITKGNRTSSHVRKSPIEKFNARYGRTDNVSSNTSNAPEVTKPQTDNMLKGNVKKPRKQPWDIEKQRQFLADCDKMTSDELMERYGFTTKKDVYSHKYLIKARLGNFNK